MSTAPPGRHSAAQRLQHLPSRPAQADRREAHVDEVEELGRPELEQVARHDRDVAEAAARHLAARIVGQLGICLDADHLAVRRGLGQRREGAQRPAAGIQTAGRRGRPGEHDQRLGLAPPDLRFERQPVDLGFA